jgi:hypothetical protein
MTDVRANVDVSERVASLIEQYTDTGDEALRDEVLRLGAGNEAVELALAEAEQYRQALMEAETFKFETEPPAQDFFSPETQPADDLKASNETGVEYSALRKPGSTEQKAMAEPARADAAPRLSIRRPLQSGAAPTTEQGTAKQAAFRIPEGEPDANSLPLDEPEAEAPEKSRDDWIAELLGLYKVKPIEYDLKLKEAVENLKVRQSIIEEEVKLRWKAKPSEEDEDAADPTQSTKLLAIGLGPDVRLWRSPEGVGYASVKIDEHWENYQIKSNSFKERLRTKYGENHRIKINEISMPQSVREAALKDAISSLEGYAGRGSEAKPAVRVGGDSKVIWLDLGRSDWSAVRITAEGWKVVAQADVPFIRPKAMLPLPMPVERGDIRKLARVLNFKPEQFVLAVAWQLQALNPVGPYPLINPNGEAEMGKTTATKLLHRTVDPNSVGIRRMNRVEDLFIAARNNWVVSFDNCSAMSADWSDALSMLATGIGIGKRANYTDDEEHSFVVERPVAFNGIPSDLTERADLASRTIKLDIPPLLRRRTQSEIEREFIEIWPEVLGALLDGLVAALRGGEKIDVTMIGLEPARLMDFEKFCGGWLPGHGLRRVGVYTSLQRKSKGVDDLGCGGSPGWSSDHDVPESEPDWLRWNDGKPFGCVRALQGECLVA